MGVLKSWTHRILLLKVASMKDPGLAGSPALSHEAKETQARGVTRLSAKGLLILPSIVRTLPSEDDTASRW